MTRGEYIALMNFPREWEQWDMLPDAFLLSAIAAYKPGDESGSEHDRNGAFHFWLRQNPSKNQLLTLFRLSLLDPDPHLASDWRGYISKAAGCDAELLEFLRTKSIEGGAQV